MKKLTIILDVDDTLMECCAPAAEVVRKEKGYDICFENMREWAFTDHPIEVQSALFEVMSREEFIRNQKPVTGAIELVRELQEMGHTVLIFSAVKPRQMGMRAEAILRHFPIPEGNIILGGHKSLMKADVLLDDAPINISASNCTFPVLMRCPWNENVACKYAVSNFEEFRNLVREFSIECM